MTIHRKVRNKERQACRGPKQRYAVWRAEHNAKWERICEARCKTYCSDLGINIEDVKSKEERNTWEHTLKDLEKKYGRLCTKSWKMHQEEEEIAELQRNAEAAKDYL